jgi:hypothetical protein
MAEPSTAQVQRGPTSGTYRAIAEPKPPLLASEALREELAPLEPGHRACRVWLVGVALALVALGVAMRLGVGVPATHVESATIAFTAAGALIAAAVLPFPYALRASVAIIAGITLMVLGLRGSGPLAGLTVDGTALGSVPRLLTLTLLPAALLFRSRYRVYKRGLVLLALALILALPFVGLEVRLAVDTAAPWVARAGAGASIAFIACSMFGFSGQHTTGWSAFWAVLVLGGVAGELALRQLTLADAGSGTLTYPATAVGLVLAAILASLGCFQLLASIWGPDARRRSLSQAKPDKEEPVRGGIA